MGVRVVISEFRQAFQFATLCFALVSLVLFWLLVRYRVFPWRLVVVPVLITAEVVVFYTILLCVNPYLPSSIGPYANNISAFLRLQTFTALTGYLSFLLYYRVVRRD